MLLKDRVMLITNVEKFAGHGTTRVGAGQGATVLAHDPSFEAPSARRKYESRVSRRPCAVRDRARDPGRAGAEAPRPYRRAGQQRRLSRPARAARRGAHGGLSAPRSRRWRWQPFRLSAARGAVDAQAQVGPHRVRVLGGAVARHRQLRALRLGARRGQRAGLLARQGARPRRHHGQCRRLELCREPRLLPAGAARQHGGDGQDDGANSAGPARQEPTSSARRSASSARTARASSPATSCRTPAVGRDADAACAHACVHIHA